MSDTKIGRKAILRTLGPEGTRIIQVMKTFVNLVHGHKKAKVMKSRKEGLDSQTCGPRQMARR